LEFEVKDSISWEVVRDGCSKVIESSISGTLGFELNWRVVSTDDGNKVTSLSLVNLLEGRRDFVGNSNLRRDHCI
jgi:hypothetical protein